MGSYQMALEQLRQRGYNGFTALQEAAFTHPDAFDESKNLFVIGETSSGKTMIPLLLYSVAVREAREQGRPRPKLLFVVPYRALSSQKMEELQEFLREDGEDMTIVQSTAEFRQDDGLIQRGEVDCAIIITEKAFKYESRNPGFLARYDFVVLDEVGLVQNAERGVRLDFVFAWSMALQRQTGRPRLIALGTPFFDWSAYIDSYHFSVIRAGERPVALQEIAIDFAKNGIFNVIGPCDFLRKYRGFSERWFHNLPADSEFTTTCPCLPEEERCRIQTPCRLDPSLPCPHTGEPCTEPIMLTELTTTQHILTSICRHHLSQGQQILLFVNDRNKVMTLTAMLYRELPEFFSTPLSDEACKRTLLEACQLEEEDVFGILEGVVDEQAMATYYRAFASGIGFHSAALPHELRAYVEKMFLQRREMKMVCSTETLAFGINSAVDVVIIADMCKQENATIRPLVLNEYQNYAGRAGRLRRDVDVSRQTGYVYTLVQHQRLPYWEQMRESFETPEKLYSLFHGERQDFMPFFLLNLMPAATDGATAQELLETVRILPHDGTLSDERLGEQIAEAVAYLERKGLLARVRRAAMGRGDVAGSQRYCLTDLGRNLRGLIIGGRDFDVVTGALNQCVSSLTQPPDRVKFLYHMVTTKHAVNGLNGAFENSATRWGRNELIQYILQFYRHTPFNASWVTGIKDLRLLSVLAAMLAWCNGESPKVLFRRFGIHYALLNRMAEQVAYLIEVAQALLPRHMERIWQAHPQQMTADTFLQQKTAYEEIFHDWFVSAFYGINVTIIRKLQDFLLSRQDPDADALAESLSLHHINPQSARQMKRMVIRHLFFTAPPVPQMDNVEARNNFWDQYNRYITDVKERFGITEPGGRYIPAFFQQEFPKRFNNQGKKGRDNP